jgi:2-C-methyl-D-erythritol 4-phosphate cytidylyltransferase
VSCPADVACHELLVRLAGRLPDRLLWRLREWLATGGQVVVAALLPRALLRHRVGLTDAERELLETAVRDRGASRRLLDAILTVDGPDEPDATFRPAPAEFDPAALSLLAVARGDERCVELRQALRADGRREQRVVLVRTDGERPWALSGTLARLLRAHGDPTPCVEVLPAADDPPAYHRAALAESAVLWRRTAAAPAGG